MTPDTVLVLDFGAQYAQLIARRVRECHVYSEVVPCDVEPEEVQRRGAKALILSRGPCSVYEAGAPPGARVTARTEATPVAGFEDPARGLYGVQFHPEVAHTPRGLDLLKNF